MCVCSWSSQTVEQCQRLVRSSPSLQQTPPKPRGLVRQGLNKAARLIWRVETSVYKRSACCAVLPRVRAEAGMSAPSALTSRVTCNARRSDHRSAKRRREEEEKWRESTLEEDILPLMSAPPLGGVSLTFTACWTAAPLFFLFFFFSVFSFFPRPFLLFFPFPIQLSICCLYISLVSAAGAAVAVCSCRTQHLLSPSLPAGPAQHQHWFLLAQSRR